MWHECSRPYRPTDEGSFGHELQVKVYLRVLTCSLKNFKPSTSPWVPWVPLWVLWGHYLYTISSLGWAETTALICLISSLLWLLLSGVGFSGLNKFEVFGVFWVSSLSRWVNVILMWMFSVLRKIVLKLNHESLLPSLFIIIILRL